MIRFDMIPTSLNSPKFNLTWKTSEKLRTEETSPDYKKNVTITCPVEVADRESLFWDYLINVALRKAGWNDGDYLSYIDPEGDEIPIESFCELEEAKKACKIIFNRNQEVHLFLERRTENSNVNAASATRQIFLHHIDSTENFEIPMESQSSASSTDSDDTAPTWFINYMQKMKEEIVGEVTERVVQAVCNGLMKCQEVCDLSSSCPPVPNSENLIDIDTADDKSSTTMLRPVNDLSTITVKIASPPSHDLEEINTVTSIALSTETSHRCQEAHNDEIASSSNSFSPDRQPDIIELKNLPEQLENSYRRMMTSGLSSIILTPVNSTGSNETLPEMIVQLTDDWCIPDTENEQHTVTCSSDSNTSPTYFSTSPDILDNTKKGKIASNSCDLLDSDNISIISENSNSSEFSNGFEIVQPPSTNLPAESPTREMMSEYQKLDEDNVENRRDSSSFELITDSPSPEIIDMNDDHFSLAEIITNDTSIVRETHSDIGNLPDLIDDDISDDDYHDQFENDDYFADQSQEKMADSVDSYINETLPDLMKNNLTLLSGSGLSAVEESESIIDGIVDDQCDNTATNIVNNSCNDSHTQKLTSGDPLHASTRIFRTAENSEYDPLNVKDVLNSSQAEVISNLAGSNVTVNHNKSKEKERKDYDNKGHDESATPKKQQEVKARKKSLENFERSEELRIEKKTTGVLRRAIDLNSNPQADERLRKRFSMWTGGPGLRTVDDVMVDPMHILPENFVTGAVNVATSAYTTARRVVDKLLTTQTKELADKRKSGQR